MTKDLSSFFLPLLGLERCNSVGSGVLLTESQISINLSRCFACKASLTTRVHTLIVPAVLLIQIDEFI